MGLYVFPIFLFGCAITGIVVLGLQQARDWASTEAAQRIQPDPGDATPAAAATAKRADPSG